MESGPLYSDERQLIDSGK